MTAQAPQVGDTSAVRKHVLLKRVFLRTLIVSLTTCALVAVGALLVGEFTELTAKVLATLGALAVHSALAMVCAATLERRRWPTLSVVGLIAFGANFGILITCIWWPGWFDEPAARAAITTGALALFYLLAIPSADLFERGTWRALSAAGLLVCVVALLMLLTCIWVQDRHSEAFVKATAIAAMGAFSFAHTALLLRVPRQRVTEWLLRVLLACVWGLAVMVAVSIIWEIEEEFWYRWLGAVGVLDACGSFALLILAKLRQINKTTSLQTCAARIELHCPRCTMAQTVDAGAAKCSACGLKFRIEIEEPRCAECGYLLWQLPQRRCPECGSAF